MPGGETGHINRKEYKMKLIYTNRNGHKKIYIVKRVCKKTYTCDRNGVDVHFSKDDPNIEIIEEFTENECPYIDKKCNTHAQCVRCTKG